MARVIDKIKVSKRLAKLRTDNHYTQPELAKKVKELIGLDKCEKGLSLDGDTGKQTISQLECGRRGLTIELATAYSEIFGVSLDYLFCLSDDEQPSNKDIKEILHFSDKAISELKSFYENNTQDFNPLYKILNLIIENGMIFKIVDMAALHIISIKIQEINDIEQKVKTKEPELILQDIEYENWIDNKNYEMWKFSENMIKLFSKLYSQLYKSDEFDKYITALAQYAISLDKQKIKDRYKFKNILEGDEE